MVSNPSRSESEDEEERQEEEEDRKSAPRYSKLLKRQSIRKNTFQFTVMYNMNQSDGEQKQKKNSYDLEYIQTQKEILFLEQYHQKPTTKTYQDYEKLFLSVVDNQDEFDDQEKKVLLDFYQMSNQRLFEILDLY